MHCKNCGEALNSIGRICTCKHCGTMNEQTMDARIQQDFLTKAIQLARSIPFLLGVVLITGSMAARLVFIFSWFLVVDAAFAGIYIVALWMTIFAKPLPALSLFRIAAIVNLVLLAINLGVQFLSVLFTAMPGFAFILFIAVIGGIGWIIIKYYFLALLNVLNSIRLRITENRFIPLEGLGSFFALSLVSIVLGIGISLFGVGYSPAWIFAITHGVGVFLCLCVLKSFE